MQEAQKAVAVDVTVRLPAPTVERMDEYIGQRPELMLTRSRFIGQAVHDYLQSVQVRTEVPLQAEGAR